jgi:predicted DNA binding protein
LDDALANLADVPFMDTVQPIEDVEKPVSLPPLTSKDICTKVRKTFATFYDRTTRQLAAIDKRIAKSSQSKADKDKVNLQIAELEQRKNRLMQEFQQREDQRAKEVVLIGKMQDLAKKLGVSQSTRISQL